MKISARVLLARLKKYALIVSDPNIELATRYKTLQKMRKIERQLRGDQ